MPEVLILTGPHGTGKSSVAEALAERYDRVAHIPVDTLRHFVTPTGYVAPGKPGFERQHALAVRNACALARNFLAERIAVIIDDVVITQSDLDAYLSELKDAGAPVHCIELMASLEVCQARNRDRKDERQPSTRVETIWRQFEAAGALPGATIECGELTAYGTADRVQALTTSGQSVVWRPG
jgi:predicted kinase